MNRIGTKSDTIRFTFDSDPLHFSGRLRLNLNPLNLVRWIDSWPFDKTWKPGWIDSTWVNRFNGRAMNLEWIFFMTPSRARKSFSKASPYFFVWCTIRTGPVYDGDRFSAVRLFRVISEDSAERDSLDESCAFLIEGAQWAPSIKNAEDSLSESRSAESPEITWNNRTALNLSPS